jgi:hypothetical protein
MDSDDDDATAAGGATPAVSPEAEEAALCAAVSALRAALQESEDARPVATAALPAACGAVGGALTRLLGAVGALSADARRAAVARALPPALALLKRAFADAAGDAWSDEVDNAALAVLVRTWNELFADGPVRLVRLAALLSPETAELADAVLADEEARWLRETAASDVAALEAVPADALEAADAARHARQLAHSRLLAAGRLPYGLRPERERDTPQLRISAAQLLTPRGRAAALALDAETLAYLRTEATNVLAQHRAGAGQPLDAETLEYLHGLADGELPRDFGVRGAL